MAGTSVSKLIIFIASLLVATSVAMTLTGSVIDIQGSLSQQGVNTANDIASDVTIASDPGSPGAIYDDGNETVTLLVKNSGSKTLTADPSSIDVLVDGRYGNVTSVTDLGERGDEWEPDETVRVTVHRDLDPGAHRAKVLAGGSTSTMRFYL
ncbi:flagella-related protein flaG [Halarchaeum acidiphilum MH1-52-1]|uniref:Flagella-related protein flaG n=1 Tax=Halarchaeum acidiphilum MH1-52-1 TaxID=1261545 RepID=U2YQT9_9EURY|nr:hypothetical protein [Halarchaeum acidiphilum]GAD51310.1 flagella-related protein flaG [Halarchaeum acidiphilum MH1-52-1]